MKLTLKLILVLCLFSSVAVADEGDMTGGGKKCPQGQASCRPQPPTPTDDDTTQTDTDSVLTIIQRYLTSIFG